MWLTYFLSVRRKAIPKEGVLEEGRRISYEKVSFKRMGA